MKLSIALAVAAALLFRADQSPKPALADLAWLAGSWSGASGGIEMEEHWTAPKGSSMIGIAPSVLFKPLRPQALKPSSPQALKTSSP